MKESELRNHTKCSLCHQLIGATGIPLFWRVTIEHFAVDLNAIRRQDGFGALLGSTMLAQVMGPDEDMATPMMEPVVLTVCHDCALKPQYLVAMVEGNNG